MKFSTLAIGGRFHVGKSYGMGARKHVQSWEVFQKLSKSLAEVVEVHGDLHSKGAGRSFSASARIFPV